jgi:hypothetical protein
MVFYIKNKIFFNFENNIQKVVKSSQVKLTTNLKASSTLLEIINSLKKKIDINI